MTLSGKDIQKKAQDVAGRLPGTSSGYPFTEHLRCGKSRAKCS